MKIDKCIQEYKGYFIELTVEGTYVASLSLSNWEHSQSNPFSTIQEVKSYIDKQREE